MDSAVNAPVDCVPEVALVPDQAPEAVQLVALVDDHVSVELPPLFTVSGFAVNVTVGAGGGGAAEMVIVTLCCALPPVPVHDSV